MFEETPENLQRTLFRGAGGDPGPSGDYHLLRLVMVSVDDLATIFHHTWDHLIGWGC